MRRGVNALVKWSDCRQRCDSQTVNSRRMCSVMRQHPITTVMRRNTPPFLPSPADQPSHRHPDLSKVTGCQPFAVRRRSLVDRKGGAWRSAVGRSFFHRSPPQAPGTPLRRASRVPCRPPHPSPHPPRRRVGQKNCKKNLGIDFL